MRLPSVLNRLGRRWVVVVLTLGAFAVAIYGALSDSGEEPSSPAPEIQPPPTQLVAGRVEKLRGLEFKRVPKVVVLDQAGLERRIVRARERSRRRINHERLERLRRAQEAAFELLKLSGLVGSGFSVKQLREASSQQIAGLTTSRERVIVVERPGESAEQLQDELAHELDHALDVQHFEALFRRRESPARADAGVGARALIEGTATRVGELYARRYLGEEHPASPAGSKLLGAENYVAGLPPPLAAEARFPYTSGTRFVSTLYARADGWRLVNRAFRHPPKTTAQVLHPRKWLEGARPPRLRFDLASALPGGWTRLGHGDSGELDVTVLLGFGAGSKVAHRVAPGWDAGWFQTWRRQGGAADECEPPCRRDNLAVLGYRWRTLKKARQFTQGAATYLTTGLFGHERPKLTWKVADGYAALGLSERGTAIAYAPSAALARRLSFHAASTR